MGSRLAVALTFLCALAVTAAGAAPAAPAPDPFVELAGPLLALQAGRGGVVRVLHFGDSHVASSPEPLALTELLQGVFGDGGAGLCLPWTPPRYTVRTGIRSGSSAGWRRVLPRGDSPEDDTGLWGCYLECESPGETAWAEGEGTSFRVTYLRRPGGGTADVFVDGKGVGRLEAASDRRGVGVFEAALAAPPGGVHRLEIRSKGGPVRILGATFENPSGLVYSPLGILGARADLLLKCREETFAALLRAERPDLVLLAFGTNESGDKPSDLAAYPATFKRVLERLRAALPGATIVVLGPPDRTGAAAGLDRIIAAQREACSGAGAAFLDQRLAMGGPGTYARWASSKPPLARPDGVHFTSDGYVRLARLVASQLLERYDLAKEGSAFQSSIRGRWGESAGPLLALAGRPTPLPAGGSELRIPSSWSEAASRDADSAPREIYYFRNAEGILVITDDPSYGTAPPSSAHPRRSGASPGEGQPYYYFQQEDGSLIITSDRDSMKGKAGRFLTPEEVSARPQAGQAPGAVPGR